MWWACDTWLDMMASSLGAVLHPTSGILPSNFTTLLLAIFHDHSYTIPVFITIILGNSTSSRDAYSADVEDFDEDDISIEDDEGTKLAEDSVFFQHTPLDHNKASMRLIHIFPSLSHEGRVQSTMHHADVPPQDQIEKATSVHEKDESYTTPTYTCLSYTRGDGCKDHAIYINAKPFKVHRNLWSFLHLARLRIVGDGGLVRPSQGMVDGPRN